MSTWNIGLPSKKRISHRRICMARSIGAGTFLAIAFIHSTRKTDLIGSIQHLMTLHKYIDTFLASYYSDIHVSIPPDEDFVSLHKVQWWWQLRWMTCLKCHPSSSKAWYRVQTTFDEPPTQLHKTQSNTIGACHYSNIHVSIPPDFAIFWSWKAQMVAVEVDDMSQMSSQLFKGLI